ncbi:PQQ-binding-like beta-propeller repeat protein [Actinobaculum sp. 313]|uniref:PQQ-binding-like beta-propeller repeat protein n=1 Tax=Actinobaculum sp. 313 TaxID=2495645 RepID=UPI000D5295DC|nr:PQQ-binding-like beta-propeller repeat protein [Actinobaculum sp. 313]AWE41573.1 hypothetical protein DDD63_00965 [Actinobaculum sp. 313]
MRIFDRRTFCSTLALTSTLLAIVLAVAARTEKYVGPSAVAVRHSPIATIVLLALAWLIVGWRLCKYTRKRNLSIAITVAGPLMAAAICLWWWRRTLITDTIGPTSMLWMAAALVAAAVAAGAALSIKRTAGKRGIRSLSAGLALLIPAALAAPLFLTSPPTYLPGHLTTTGATPGQAPQQRELGEDTEVLWVREGLDQPYYGFFNTDAGPVLITRAEAQLLDPATGETIWSYSRGPKQSPVPIASAATTSGDNPTLELTYYVQATDDGRAYYSQVVVLDPATGKTLRWQDAYSANTDDVVAREPDFYVKARWGPSSRLDIRGNRWEMQEDGTYESSEYTFTLPISTAYLSSDPHVYGRLYDTGEMYLLVIELNGPSQASTGEPYTLIYALH